MIAYQRTQQNPVLATTRPYVPGDGPAIDIIPLQSSSTILGKAKQEINEDTSINAHVIYGARDVLADVRRSVGDLLTRDSPVTEFGGTLHIDRKLTPIWTIGLYGSYSTLEQSLTLNSPGGTLLNQPGDSSLAEFALSANAEPLTFYGHPVNVSFGAGGRKETLTIPTSVYRTSYTSLARKVGDMHLETFLPLTSRPHPFLNRLELSLAAREDYYEVIGPTLNPKAGLVWSPGVNLNVRGTFARAFRPPTLDELAAIPAYYTVNVPDHSGLTDTLVDQSQGIARLRPETARTITGGLDYGRDRTEGWTGSATWFRTVFYNRVAWPLIGSVSAESKIYAQPELVPFIIRSVIPARVQADFASPGFLGDFAGGGVGGVKALFDDELTNMARTFQEGLEASLRYSRGERPRQFGAFVIANYLLRDMYRSTPAALTVSVANNVGQLPNLRARGGVSWSRDEWKTALNVNYTSGYHNAFVSPIQNVHSWTTLDLQVAYQLPSLSLPVHNLELTFNAQNLLNAAPPHVALPAGLSLRHVGFDAANAFPFGRTVSLDLSVAW
jgi:outer membrane receptor protein involved in Fe transport